MATAAVERRVTMFEQYRDGATYQEIGDTHGMTKQRAYQILSRMGVTERRKLVESGRPRLGLELQPEGVHAAADNPLRLWRKAHSVKIRDVAGRVGVAANTVTLWESGSIKPSRDNMARLMLLTGDNNLARDWEDWHSGKIATSSVD